MRKLRRVGTTEDDPLDGVANFFDLGVIMALGFLVPLMANMAMLKSPPLPTQNVKPDIANSKPLDRYRPSTDRLTGEGERLGVAYRLKSGEVIYVPETGEAPASAESKSP